jgi:hypothetical protein
LYVQALVASNRLQQTNLTYILGKELSKNPRFAASGTGGGNGFGGSDSGGGGYSGGSGTEDSPLVVTMLEPNMKSQFWKLVRSIIILLIVISAFSGIMEEKGLGGMGGKQTNHEVMPDTTSKVYTFDDVQGADEVRTF